jgi:hypothetical protein
MKVFTAFSAWKMLIVIGGATAHEAPRYGSYAAGLIAAMS